MKNTVSKNQERLNFLDIYKGIAILFVIITHYQWKDAERLTYLFPYWIKMAVPLFLVITGYVSAYSSEKKGISLSKSYKPIDMIVKLLRYLIPFIPVYIIILLVRIFLKDEHFSFTDILLDFICGGDGRGSYYVPIMIQITLLIPLIRFLVKRNQYLGLIICFIVNIIYEIFKTIIHMDPDIYRIISLRYLFIVAFGCFLFYKKQFKKIEIILFIFLGLCGGVYIYLFDYIKLNPIFIDQWTDTSCFAVLYAVPIFALLFSFKKLNCKPLQIIGNSSYGIYLIQMIFYFGPHKILYKLIDKVYFRLPIILIICFLFGILYYKVENMIFQKTVIKLKEHYLSRSENSK